MATGLDFPSNNTANSDIRLIWDGSHLLPRDNHTAIWRYRPRQHTGYYALAWHSPNTGIWDSGAYSSGNHPFPASNGTVESDGNAATGTGAAGTVHWWEIAGSGAAKDYLTSAGGTVGVQVVKDKLYVQVRRCRKVGSVWEHTFHPDLIDNPNFFISISASTVTSGGGGNAFYFGASDWTATGNQNEECPSGVLRGIQLYNNFLPIDIATTEALNDTLNSPTTVSGTAHIWYINQNPTSADVSDKYGTGHDPRWANTNRPALFSSASDYGTSVTLGVLSASYSFSTPSINYGSTISMNVLSASLSLLSSIIRTPLIEISSASIRLRY